MQYWVYILSCADGTYHWGIAKDLEARLAYHTEGKNPESPTFHKRPVHLVFKQAFSDIRAAKQAQAQLSEANIPQVLDGTETLVSDLPKKASTATDLAAPAVVPTSYIPNLAYFNHIKDYDLVIWDVYENFQKQTYRSRATIYAANGIQNLVVPVTRPYGKNTHIRNVGISYAEDWQKDHIRAIESAYRRAPFYEHYAPALFAIIKTRFDYLVDLNKAILDFLIRSFDLDLTLTIGNEDDKAPVAAKILVTPKARNKFQSAKYVQALNENEFEHNLSAIDLLMNEGKGGARFFK